LSPYPSHYTDRAAKPIDGKYLQYIYVKLMPNLGFRMIFNYELFRIFVEVEKDKFNPTHAMESYMVSGGISPLNLSLSARWS
jgi:hypothetical protein